MNITDDILLRPLLIEDAEEIFNAIDTQREYFGKWLPFVAHTTSVNFTKTFINTTVNAPSDRFEPTFTIRKNDNLVGFIGFTKTDKLNRKTEIGYWLSESFQGQGIITKSIKELCKYAFEELNINRIQIKCAVGNTPSSSIPKRLGFQFEGIERAGEFVRDNIYFDVEVYSILKSEFKY